MSRTRLLGVPFLLVAVAGCQLIPNPKLAAIESQNRVLQEQSKAQIAEIENLKEHGRTLADHVVEAEEELAVLDRKLTGGLLGPGGGSAAGIDLMRLAERYSVLRVDQATGVGALQEDLHFASGEATLGQHETEVLDELADLLMLPEGRNLRVMIVGHADDRLVAKRETRDAYRDNWHLSTARALAVAEYLERSGVGEDQLGVVGYGRHQPLASNETSADRQRNRRTEVFVIGPQTPLLGWHSNGVERY